MHICLFSFVGVSVGGWHLHLLLSTKSLSCMTTCSMARNSDHELLSLGRVSIVDVVGDEGHREEAVWQGHFGCLLVREMFLVGYHGL